MKRLLRLSAILLLPLLLHGCGVTLQYVGNSYPATDAPELYFDRADVPRPYMTMGYAEATYVFKVEEAQAAIEHKAREKGADAIIFGRPGQKVVDPTVCTTVSEEQDLHGNRTQTISTAQTARRTSMLHATFLKYKE